MGMLLIEESDDQVTWQEDTSYEAEDVLEASVMLASDLRENATRDFTDRVLAAWGTFPGQPFIIQNGVREQWLRFSFVA